MTGARRRHKAQRRPDPQGFQRRVRVDMRPVSLSDAIFFNLGDRYITSVCLFETPLDPRRLRAELADAAAENPALREKVRRRWPGFVAAL
ncbi:MAG TPA: hypothetical protein PLQ12_05900, partial [Candidatus Defluviicoccus seviourii]|nr:hypothetical protein [Candidatus Defluviicoccus seviourii]